MPATNKIQFQIKRQSGDEVYVEEVCARAAAQFSLVDVKVTSRVERTICNYSEGLENGFGFGAHTTDDLVLVDFNPIGGRTEKFNVVFEFIVSKLREHFGDRICLADKDKQIPAINTLPMSDAARAFISKMMKEKYPE